MVLKYIVTDTKYQNINQLLKQEFHISARLQHKLILAEQILLNGVSTDTRTFLSLDDVVEINLDFEEESENIVATEMKLNIIYEDDAFLILNKPAGIAVHPSILHYEDSLSNGVKFYFESIGLKRKIRPVNRLDLNTSGLIVFAKNEYVQECLIKQMKENIFKKEYIAIVHGVLENKKGTISLPIARKHDSIIERCISDDGQEAITDYTTLKILKDLTVVKCFLRTGRTHQIRVHMSAIGHPLIGDTLYGKSSKLIARQALHSYKVSFLHPINKTILELTCDVPDDMQDLGKAFKSCYGTNF